MNLATSFCEKIKNGVHYRHSKAIGPKPNQGKFGLLKCRSALQKCRIGSWRLNALSCSGAIWSLLLGFFGQSLYLDVFSTSVYDFLVSFLHNLGFFKSNYLEDKYLKINLDKIQIIHSFIVIQSFLLFLCMHPYFKH